MKTLIVAAFLVASVASQGMDWYNPLMNVRPMRTDMDMPMHYSMDTMDTVDTTYGRCMGGRCLIFEELMSHPLFHSYLRMPLFRMFLERHPMTMRKFVESPLFQNYWMNPEFRMYFRNPVLFYKYIMPLINIVSNNMYSDVETTTNTPWTTPYSYNPYRRQSYPMSRDTMSCGFRCRYLLNKINNRMGMDRYMGMDRNMEIGNNREIETLTDVKMLPNGRVMEQTFGKVVDPFTGEDKLTTGDIKTFHEAIVPVVPEMMTTFVQSTDITQKIDEIIRNHYEIMTREILRNILGSEEAITTEQYNTVRAILKNQKNNVIPRLERVLRERKTMTPEMKEELYTILREHKKRVIPEIISAVLGSRPTPVMYNKVDQVLEKHHRLIVREIVREIFGVEIPLTMDEEVFTPYPMF